MYAGVPRIVPACVSESSARIRSTDRSSSSPRRSATPRTFAFYAQSPTGTSFGTKFEGLTVSADLPGQIRGLFHAGSVGIIMSGWLGAANYGAIVANKVDALLHELMTTPAG